MTRFFIALAASGFAFLAASCCCTSDVKAPGLRALPQFREIQTTTTEEVNYTK